MFLTAHPDPAQRRVRLLRFCTENPKRPIQRPSAKYCIADYLETFVRIYDEHFSRQ